jgi:6-phosphogluconolactonase
MRGILRSPDLYDMNRDYSPLDRSTRRSLLWGALATPLAWSAGQGPRKARYAYAGTYSSPQGPEGSKGRGQGICLFDVEENGSLKQKKVFPNDANPAWLAWHPSRKYLYSGNEVGSYGPGKTGSVTAYSVNGQSGELTALNTVSSGAAGPAHISVHPSGKFVFTANYAGGAIAVLPIEANGKLGEPVQVIKDEGKPGGLHAASAPPGSFAISGHDRPHAHMIEADPTGRFVISTDLGLDRVYVWKVDLNSGKLSPNDPGFVSLPDGDGPRHFVFHPKNGHFYCLQEESSTIAVFAYDAQRGRLTPKQTLSTLPAGFKGTNFTSEIAISPDGRFIYAANRLHDSIAYFVVQADGQLKFAGEAWTRGDYPRSFSIDLTGRYLYTCNQRADAIGKFTINNSTGDLTFSGEYTAVGTPAILVFLS